MSETHVISRRSWLRFNLRSLFVVLTGVGVWLGWELFRMRQRAESRTWIVSHGGVWDGFDGARSAAGTGWEGLRYFPIVTEAKKRVSLSRRLLGDTAVMYIGFPHGAASEGDLTRLKKLFPEAFVVEVDVEVPK